MNQMAGAVSATGAWTVIVAGIFTDVNPVLTGLGVVVAVFTAMASFSSDARRDVGVAPRDTGRSDGRPPGTTSD